MSNRITEAMLTNAAKDLADALGAPFGQHLTPGSIVLSGAYGGWQLQKVVTDGGGIINLTSGFIPKRELYYIIMAMRQGASMSKAAQP